MKQVHVYIKGKVVGVFFRAWTQEQATKLGITGWVTNVYDNVKIFGNAPGVEAVFQGTSEQINQMLELIKHGSPLSQVEDVIIKWENISEEFFSFQILG